MKTSTPGEIQPAPRRAAAPEIDLEHRRPLPYAEPAGINDNGVDPARAPRPQRRPLRLLRLLARIVIAPLYIAVAACTVGIIVLFVRGFLAP